MNFREKRAYIHSLGWSIEQRQEPDHLGGKFCWCYVEYDDDEDIHGSFVYVGGKTYEEAVERAYASRMLDEQNTGIHAIIAAANEEYSDVILH